MKNAASRKTTEFFIKSYDVGKKIRLKDLASIRA